MLVQNIFFLFLIVPEPWVKNTVKFCKHAMIQLQKKSGENSDQPVSKFGLENIIN
jgi:hypothetical protein